MHKNREKPNQFLHLPSALLTLALVDGTWSGLPWFVFVVCCCCQVFKQPIKIDDARHQSSGGMQKSEVEMVLFRISLFFETS
jgi:hypothetical protein